MKWYLIVSAMLMSNDAPVAPLVMQLGPLQSEGFCLAIRDGAVASATSSEDLVVISIRCVKREVIADE